MVGLLRVLARPCLVATLDVLAWLWLEGLQDLLQTMALGGLLAGWIGQRSHELGDAFLARSELRQGVLGGVEANAVEACIASSALLGGDVPSLDRVHLIQVPVAALVDVVPVHC